MEASAATGPALGTTRPRVAVRMLAIASDERLVAAVRGGSERAFEAIFDRYQRGLLAFCRHMLGSVEEAEDAVQHVLLAAYRDLTASDRAVDLRPWLYAIARNRCLSVLRARRDRPAELPADAATDHLSAEVQRRHDVRELLEDVAKLPEEQRAALVLAELATMPHAEIAAVLGCPREKVKALVFQARSSLIATRAGRETPCSEIQRQLATQRGGALRRTVLRRHLRDCAACREFRSALRRQRRLLGVALPVAPSAALKGGALAGLLGGETLAGGGATALVAKALTVAAVAGAGSATAIEVRDRAPAPPSHVAAKPPAAKRATAARSATPAAVRVSARRWITASRAERTPSHGDRATAALRERRAGRRSDPQVGVAPPAAGPERAVVTPGEGASHGAATARRPRPEAAAANLRKPAAAPASRKDAPTGEPRSRTHPPARARVPRTPPPTATPRTRAEPPPRARVPGTPPHTAKPPIHTEPPPASSPDPGTPPPRTGAPAPRGASG
jgi:RNA polymerase sigma factor (sigma-70 family)